MDDCEDGKCHITREGIRHTHYRTYYNKKIKERDEKGSLSVLFLIIGVGFGLLVFLLNTISDMSFQWNCIGHAIYENSTVNEYTKCINKNIETWNYIFIIHVIATLSLAASAIIALLRKIS